MANKPLMRPAISWGVGIGGVGPLDSHYISQKTQTKTQPFSEHEMKEHDHETKQTNQKPIYTP